MQKLIIADANPHEARVALLEDGKLVEVQLETRDRKSVV